MIFENIDIVGIDVRIIGTLEEPLVVHVSTSDDSAKGRVSTISSN